jgi:hypothetical protein
MFKSGGRVLEVGGSSRWGWILSPAAAEMYIRGLSGEELSSGCPTASELIAKGFAATTRNEQLVCLAPEVPIVRAMAAETQRWLSLRPDLEAMQADLADLVARDRVSVQRLGKTISEHTVPAEVVRVMESAFGGARHELLVMHRTPPTPSRFADKPPVFAPLDGAVSSRYLYDRAVLLDRPFLTAVLEQVANGAEARIVHELPADVLIVDRRTLIVLDLDGGPTAIHTTAATMVDSFSALFDMYWAAATPLGISPTADPDEMSERDKQILAKLLGVDPVEKIARDLRVNRRTIQRRAHEIYDSFSVENRIQLRDAVHRLSHIRQPKDHSA